jgi:hypothetical protein
VREDASWNQSKTPRVGGYPRSAVPVRREVRRRVLLLLTTSVVAIGAVLLWVRLEGTRLATLNDPLITESSGLVGSLRNPGVLWTMNDSDNPPLLFATDRSGRALGRFLVTGASNHDWEDLGISRAPDGTPELYIADTGENSQRESPIIYRLQEPAVDLKRTERRIIRTEKADAFPLVYAGGTVDIETILVHPQTGEILLVGKTGDSRAPVFRVGPLTQPRLPVEMEPVTTIELPRLLGPLNAVTGGAVAPDGSRFVIRTPLFAFEWRVPSGATLAEAILGEPHLIPLFVPSIRGEGIAYDPDGEGLLTTSEGSPAPLFRTELSNSAR